MGTTTKIEDPGRELSEEEERLLMKRISSVRTRLLALVPFFGHLALNLKPRAARPQDNVATAAVAPDGTLILNFDFCSKLDDAEMAGLLCHEVLHPALFCWQRQGTRRAIVEAPDPMNPKGRPIRFSLWNLAHDLSFNPEILELAERSDARGAVKLPEGGAIDLKYKGKSAEEIYDELLTQAEKNGGGGGGSAGMIKIPGGGHSIGDDMREDLASTPEGQKAAAGDPGARTKLENDWKTSVVAAAQVQEKEKGKGSLPAGLQKIVDEITDPKVPWQDVLSRWIGENGRRQDWSYRRPSRRSETIGEFMPSLRRFGVDDVCVLWDTSGSMNGRECDILSEVHGICEDLGIGLRVICCDTVIHSDVCDIRDALDVIPHIKGGGGSSLIPAFKKLEDEGYDGIVVVFTDGYIDVPETKPPLIKDVLWCLTKQDVDPTHGRWGEVLVIEDDPTTAGTRRKL